MESPLKRKNEETSLSLLKKQKVEKRSSSLPNPTMILSGHLSEVYSCKYNPHGTILASGSFDKTILLWNSIDLVNYSVLKGHSNAVLDLDWTTDGTQLVSASADKSVILWDAETGKQTKRYKAHSSYVNTISTSRFPNSNLFVTGSDDSSSKIWDIRSKTHVSVLKCKYPVFGVSLDLQESRIFTGGLDNVIKIWDFKTFKEQEVLKGHQDSITGIKLSPDGEYLLSNSMDNSLRLYDIKPFTKGDRCKKIFYGHSHGIDRNLLKCSFNPQGNLIASGSSDQNVYVWDIQSTNIFYKLPGHKSTVNEVVFHPKEPIITSCSSDKNIYLGEI